MLFAATIWSFVREFSSLEVYACWTRNVLIGRVRDRANAFGRIHWFGLRFHVAVPILSATWVSLLLSAAAGSDWLTAYAQHRSSINPLSPIRIPSNSKFSRNVITRPVSINPTVYRFVNIESSEKPHACGRGSASTNVPKWTVRRGTACFFFLARCSES